MNWSEPQFTELRPRVFGATVHTPQLTTTLYRDAGGSSWEEHQHPQDQITTVVEGAIDFVVGGQAIHLASGQQLAAVPGGTLLGEVPECGTVTLNVFTP